MNLYRSFGNLMEVWVAEELQSSCCELLGSHEGRPPPPPTNLRSESVDSGVEMASYDMSFHTTCGSVSADAAELDGFTPDRDASRRASESSVLSCTSPSSPFSPCLPPGGARDRSSILHQRVEAALQRSNSKHLKHKPACLTAVEIRRRDSRVHQRPASASLRGQRSDRFDLRRMFNPSEPLRLTGHRRPSVASDTLALQRNVEDLSGDEAKGLSPGLCYLEHVCQMLEEFAEQQWHNQALQREKNSPQTPLKGEACRAGPVVEASRQAFGSSQTDSGAARGEERSPRERRHPTPLHRHFRQRSASDVNVATLHLRKNNTSCRGQHLSTDDLLMELNRDLEKQGTGGKKNTLGRSWKIKIGALTRHFSVTRDAKSQQMQPTEKKQARPRLSQLFRRSKQKTMSP